MTTPRLHLVDGSGYIFRAYHALPPLTRKSDGLPVGAVSGFCNMLWKLLNDMQGESAPTHLAVVFDASERTFRTEIDPNYKAHRPPAPDDLVQQFPLIRQATEAFGVACLELAGYEADDIIAAYACRARDSGASVVIVSSDKDLMQLVGDHVVMLDPIKQVTIGREQVVEKFGVPPEKVIDVQALVGDSVDNVPGAPGIGVKTASALITEFGDLDTLLARAGEIKQEKRRQTLIDYADQIRLSRRLVTLDCNTPMPAPLEALEVRQPDGPALHAFLETMEFRGLSRRVQEGKGAAPAVKAYVEPGERAAPEPQAIDCRAYPCVRDLETLDDWIARAVAAGVVAFDAETDNLVAANAELLGVSLALSPGQACFIPLRAPAEGLDLGTPEGPPVLDREAALQRLKPLLEHPGVLKIIHASKYDLAVMAGHGVAIAPVDDTQLISYALDGGLHPHTLERLSELHLGHKPLAGARQAASARAQKSFAEMELGEAAAAEDVDIAVRLHGVLRPRLLQEGLLTVYETLERPLPHVLAEMERAGIAVDPDKLRQLSQTFGARIAELETEAHGLAGRPFNLGSPKQLGELLFDELGLPGGKRTATGQWMTDAGTLEDLAAQGHGLPKAVLEHRQLSKLKGTYTDALTAAIHPRTGRVHTTSRWPPPPRAAVVGRPEPAEHPHPHGGRARDPAGLCGGARPSADLGRLQPDRAAHPGAHGRHPRAEARLFPGHRHPRGHRVRDVRRARGGHAVGDPPPRQGDQLRHRLRHLGLRPVEPAGHPPGRGRGLYQDLFRALSRHPCLYGRHQGGGAAERLRLHPVRPQGPRPRDPGQVGGPAPGRRTRRHQRPHPGAAADIIRRAMVRMPLALERAGLRTRMLLQVHDELVFEAPDDEVEAAIAVIRPVMERAADPAVALSVPLVVDARAAMNWDEAH
jgi:DNA polymerase-1